MWHLRSGKDRTMQQQTRCRVLSPASRMWQERCVAVAGWTWRPAIRRREFRAGPRRSRRGCAEWFVVSPPKRRTARRQFYGQRSPRFHPCPWNSIRRDIQHGRHEASRRVTQLTAVPSTGLPTRESGLKRAASRARSTGVRSRLRPPLEHTSECLLPAVGCGFASRRRPCLPG